MNCPSCGTVIEPEAPKKGKPRSVPQHRRYFALIRAAFYHWPDKHSFRPMSEEHLRKWLQAKAGHRTVTTIDTAGMTNEQAAAAIAAQVKKAGPFAFHEAKGSRFYSIESVSVDFDTLPHLEACGLFDAVADIIEAETGLRCDDMISTAPRKARTFERSAAA